MAIRNIVMDNEEIIRKKSREVIEFNQKLWDLLDDMYETMQKNEGVGLAAVQVGILKRVAIVDIGDGKFELINPVIVVKKGKQTGSEGCLSSPEEYGDVTRPMYVQVKAFNRSGKEYFIQADELFARALCHEIDHLDGKLFKDLATDVTVIDEESAMKKRRRR